MMLLSYDVWLDFTYLLILLIFVLTAASDISNETD